jgi:protein TonB
MNGYKTGGDWTDVTSIDRNEVVFDGRHKAYGAYYIRQRYKSALLIALLSGITIIALPVMLSYVFRGARELITPTTPDVVVNPTDVIIPITKPHVIPPHTPPPPKTPSTNNGAPPLVVDHLDTNKAPTPENHEISLPAGPTGTGTPTTDANPPSPGTTVPTVEDNEPKQWVNDMPKFPGGKIEEYLAGKLQYPPEAIEVGRQGIAYVSFVIERDGSVSNVTLKHGIANGDDLNKEAMRVISEMPKWSPGKQDGHPVRVQFVVPIHFKIQ